MKRSWRLAAFALATVWSIGGCISMGADHNAIYRAKCPVTPEQMRPLFEKVVFGVADRLRSARPDVRGMGAINDWFAPMGWRLKSSPNGPDHTGSILFSTHELSWIDDSNLAAVILGDPAHEDDAIRQVRAAIEAELKAGGCTWTYNYQMKMS